MNERGSQTFSWVSENAEEKSMPGIPQFLLIVTNLKKKKEKRILAEFKMDKGQHHRISKLFPKMSRAFSLVLPYVFSPCLVAHSTD